MHSEIPISQHIVNVIKIVHIPYTLCPTTRLDMMSLHILGELPYNTDVVYRIAAKLARFRVTRSEAHKSNLKIEQSVYVAWTCQVNASIELSCTYTMQL